jgi:hypothetical protein
MHVTADRGKKIWPTFDRLSLPCLVNRTNMIMYMVMVVQCRTSNINKFYKKTKYDCFHLKSLF